MPTAIVTGSGGLVGSEAVRHFIEAGFRVIGIDNDMRRRFFGDSASTAPRTEQQRRTYDKLVFESHEADIRDLDHLEILFARHRPELVIHAAAQPAHDWAAKEPRTDFAVNALGTLNMLEATRNYTPDATFVYCSTSKVYGDNPNLLPLEDHGDRLELPQDHRYYEGIDTSMSIDGCTHSLFGVSKASADLLVQEYGRYFDMPTVCFRPGCISGPNHAGAQLHGFLSYLMRCVMAREDYTVIGYEGKQVRCNIHAVDLVRAFEAFHTAPRAGAVYNIGGGRLGACSMREAIQMCHEIAQREMLFYYHPTPRIGDHRWWISDNRPFERDYPGWSATYTPRAVLTEIYEQNQQWLKP